MFESITLKTEVTRSVRVKKTARVTQLDGMFDIPPADEETVSWDVDIDIPTDARVIVIVGPSGTGKTTLAGELFGAANVLNLGKALPWTWPADEAIVDGFKPAAMKETTGLLSSVGFSSPRAWRKPFGVLSNGQQFRVNLARALATLEKPVIDEFGAYVDPQIRQVCAAAVAKAVRRMDRRFVAITPHDDCVDYFEPDVIIEIKPGEPVTSRVTRGSVRRPPIDIEIKRVHRSAWERFKHAHYLSADIHHDPVCFVGYIDDQPAVFTAVMHFPMRRGGGRGSRLKGGGLSYREHRTVCLECFQGVGIGNAFSERIASMFAAKGCPFFSLTSSPSMISHRRRRPDLWRMARRPGISSGKHTGFKSKDGVVRPDAGERITATFEYVGPSSAIDAKRFGLL